MRIKKQISAIVTIYIGTKWISETKLSQSASMSVMVYILAYDNDGLNGCHQCWIGMWLDAMFLFIRWLPTLSVTNSLILASPADTCSFHMSSITFQNFYISGKPLLLLPERDDSSLCRENAPYHFTERMPHLSCSNNYSVVK